MAKTTIKNIKEEFVNFLRNQDLISVSDRGVTTYGETQSLTAAGTAILSNSPTLLKNVRSIIVGGTALVYGTNYSVNFDTGLITFGSNQTGTAVFSYDSGSSDRIFYDYPQPYLKLKDFPRMGFDIISAVTNEVELGAGSTDTEYILSIVAYDADQDNVESMISSTRESILDNKKNFYYIPFITPTNMGSIIVSPFGQSKIMQRNQDCLVKFVFEN